MLSAQVEEGIEIRALSLKMCWNKGLNALDGEGDMLPCLGYDQLSSVVDDRGQIQQAVPFEGLHWRGFCCGAE